MSEPEKMLVEETVFDRLKAECVWSQCSPEVRDAAISAIKKTKSGTIVEFGSGKSVD